MTRSAIGAMREVTDIVRRGTKKASQHKEFCVLVAIDVRNAFNVARWSGILADLEARNVDRHLIEMVRNYLSDRTLVVDEGSRMRLTCGVLQGSILGPLLCNVYYDNVFRVKMPDGLNLIGYADDLELVAVGKSETELRHKIDTALVDLVECLQTKELRIAPEKTEVVLLSGRRKIKEITVTVAREEVRSKNSVKYLGVIFDKNTRFTEHVKHVMSRANEVATKLGRLMPNIGGPRSTKRRVLCGAIGSITLYAAPIWGGVMGKEKYRQMLIRVQRKLALRKCSAYRIVFTEAAQVLAELVPIDLQVQKRMNAYDTQQGRREPRWRTMGDWQARCNNLRGREEWTRTLIADVEEWPTRQHGQVG